MARHSVLMVCVLGALATLTTGCLSKSWEAGWWEAGKASPSAISETRLTIAREAFAKAGDGVTLLTSMDAYRAVLETDPGNAEALTYLGNQHILLGTAYTKGRAEKTKHFQRAMRYCELAMYTNTAFKKEVDSGKKPWDAAHTLTAKEAQAMLFWVTALQYEFKEGMGLLGKITNVGWMKYGIIFLDQIKKVAPDFGNGAVEFAYTICYSALPEFKGGDKEKGIAFMKQAVENGDGYLLARWARGKYFQQVTGDTAVSRADLEWILKQDLKDYKDPYPWRVHFIEDAKIQLAEL